MKEWRTLNLYQEDNLLIDEEAVIDAAKAAKYGNVYGVYGAGLASLPALETIDISDTDTVADVSEKLNIMFYDMDMNGSRCGEALDIAEDFDVVYCHKLKKFIAVSDMIFYPVYLFWDAGKEDFKSIWLNEPEHIIDTPDEPDITMSDKFGHMEVYEIYQLDSKPVYDKCLLRYVTQKDQPTGLIMSSRELRELLSSVESHMKGVKK